MLREVARDTATNPDQPQATRSQHGREADVHAAVPPVKRRRGPANVRDQLQYATRHPRDRQQQVQAQQRVAQRICRVKASRQHLAPSLVVPGDCGAAVEDRYIRGEDRLAREGSGQPRRGAA